ncbi:MAG: BTAD domain-containing putative transcriptional regulator, partial [Solirubrobacteraceae bacterium]
MNAASRAATRSRAALEFRLLGPVDVVRDGQALAVGGPRQLSLLTMLLLQRDRVVSTDRLVEDLWAGAPSAGARTTIRSYASRVRALLDCDPGVTLCSRAGGYVLTCDGDRVDSVRFERLGVEGRTRLAAGDARAASDLFARALALWRGPVLTPVADKPFARLEAVRLDELRLTGLEGWVEAELALGHHADLVGRLEALTGEHPLRERLWAALMTALYRCDRRADALDAYARVRALLVEQLGLEPGERLRRLQTAILRDELAAARASAPRAQETRAPPPPLPLRLTSFVGRERELRELGELVGRARLVTLVGLGGAGKTRLALEAAACAPDACFVDLSALAGPAGAELVEQRIAVALNVEERSGGELGELLAEHVGPGASLLVLDNCEHVVDAVAAVAVDLLRRCRGLVILATSRRPLG